MGCFDALVALKAVNTDTHASKLLPQTHIRGCQLNVRLAPLAHFQPAIYALRLAFLTLPLILIMPDASTTPTIVTWLIMKFFR